MNAADPADSTGKRHNGLIYFLLLSAGVLPYLNTLWASFVYDDHHQLVENPYIHSFHYLKQILTSSVWSFRYVRVPTNYYRPLMSLEYVILYKAYGPLAYVFHLANVLTHAVVVILLFMVTRKLLKSERTAFVAAAIFALHPIHTESVAWVAAVPDIQLAVFLLIAFWFYLDIGEPGRSRRWTPVALNLAFFLALFSKEPAVAFPAIAVFYEHFLRPDRHVTSWKIKLKRYSSLFVLTGFYLGARLKLIGGLVPKLQRPRLSWPSALLSAVSLFGQYMNKLVLPVRLKMFYEFHATTSILDATFLVGLAWMLAILLLCWFLWNGNRVLILPVLWMVATLAPALNARWMPGNAFAERYAYVPSIGFCMILAAGLLTLWNIRAVREHGSARVALATAVLLAAFFSTFWIVKRNAVWHDDVTFFGEGVRQSPNNANLHSDLGFAYWVVRDTNAAVEQWRISVALDPDNFWALNNMGMANNAEEHYEEAILELQRAVKLRPEFAAAHMNLADAFRGLHRDAEAESEYQAAIDSSPLDYDTHNRVAIFYRDTGRVDEARKQYRLSFDAEPNAEALDGLGDIALRDGQTALAESYFVQAVGMDSYDHHAHYKLVGIYAASGRTAQALREFELGQQTDVGTDPLSKQAKAIVDKLKNSK